ncbi:MAG: hypothetical protein LBP60_02700 [Spirochaetaceae bacterium]|jgi:hypothetical protein|nr:hypothetical protein [Spirochaetaceae bacterium]
MGNSIIIGNNNFAGQNIIIQNGEVIIDGRKVDLPKNENIINIVAESLESLRVDSCNGITVKGDAGGIKISQGRLSVDGNVKGDVHITQGNVHCGNIEGDISVAMGNIRTRRG